MMSCLCLLRLPVVRRSFNIFLAGFRFTDLRDICSRIYFAFIDIQYAPPTRDIRSGGILFNLG